MQSISKFFKQLGIVCSLVIPFACSAANNCTLKVVNKTSQVFTEMSSHVAIFPNSSFILLSRNCEKMKFQQKTSPAAISKNGFILSYAYYPEGSAVITITGQAQPNKLNNCGDSGCAPNQWLICTFDQVCYCTACSH